MESRVSRFVMVLAALGLFAGGIALAEQARSQGGPAAEATSHGGPHAAEWAEFKAFKLEKLHAALKLDQAQENAWKEWVGKIGAGQLSREERRKEFEALSGLTAPERMERMLAFARDRLGMLERRLAATKALYANLSPDQRQIFDREFSFGPRRHGR